MYTIIYLDPNQEAEIVQMIRRQCNTLFGTTASQAPFGDMYVKYASQGISCQFDGLVTRLPVLFRDLRISCVTIMSDHSDPGFQPGVYKRKHSWGVVDERKYTSTNGPTYYVQKVTLTGDNLDAVVRLYLDLRNKTAKPRQPWAGRSQTEAAQEQ